jgi:gluconokinase
MTSDCVLGVDLGTSGARAVLVGSDGQILAQAGTAYHLFAPRTDWAEQEADEVLAGASQAVRQALAQSGRPPAAVRALALSGVLHSLLAVDAAGRPLGRALTWADSRAAAQARAIADSWQALYPLTGCPPHPLYPLAKVRWFRERAPEIFARAARFVSLKEYVLYHWTGRWVIDHSLASGTGLFDLRRLTWLPAALDLAGLDPDRLSEPVAPTARLPFRPVAARTLGLSPEVVLVPGAGDGPLACLGAGGIGPGQLTATVGTSGAVRAVLPAPRTDPERRTWCYYLAEGHWVAGGAINNAGLAYRWLAQQVLGLTEDAAEQLAAEAPPGAGGLLCLPFLTGERSPYWNADARGLFVGLSLEHDRRHLLRAMVEGVCFRLRSVAEAVAAVAGPPVEIRLTGGLLHSPLWTQTLADVLGWPLRRPTVSEASAYGAALLALRALERLPSLEAGASLVGTADEVQPQPERQALYESLYRLYWQVYWHLQPDFPTIAALQRRLAGERDGPD